MLERILIAGSGGQGVVLAGKLLASSAARDIPHVTFFPDYGAEVRGGTSKCQVTLSSHEIASPVSDAFETMLIMNSASMDSFTDAMPAKGVTFLNSSLCTPPADLPGPFILVPATETADGLGDVRSANFVMLGAYLKHRPFVPARAVEEVLRAALSKKGNSLVDLNLKALRAGMSA